MTHLPKAGPVLCAPRGQPGPGISGGRSCFTGGLSGASSPPQAEVLLLCQRVQAALSRGEQPGLFVIFKEGPGGIPGIFFSKINRTLDLFHQKKKKKKEQALFLVGIGLEPGEEGAAAEGEGRPEATFLPPQGVSSTKEQ